MNIPFDRNILKAFYFANLIFELEPIDEILLPPYKGSALRGSFGFAFKKAVCPLKENLCDSCLLRGRCVYSYIFDTPTPTNTKIMRKYTRAPHPFVIEPPEKAFFRYRPGEIFKFGLVLIGKAIEYLPYFIYSFHILGDMGLGKGRGRFFLKSVKALENPSSIRSPWDQEEGMILIYEGISKRILDADIEMSWEKLLQHCCPGNRITFDFITPARIKFEGHYILELEFHILLRSLLRRISTLYYFHCGGAIDLNFKDLIERSKSVFVENKELRWYDWERYSGRQETRMKMGGFVGSITFRGDMEPFWPFLLLGEVIHVGKGTSFGLGQYRIKIP
jgi:CRISPR-associated endoribonuclease Cas6